MSVSGGSDSSSYIETELASIEKNGNILTSKEVLFKANRWEVGTKPSPSPSSPSLA